MTTSPTKAPPTLALRSKTLRIAAPLLLILAVAILVGGLDLGRDLGRVRAAMLSGAPEGNYAAIVDRLSALAARDGGHIEGVPSAGSAETLARLAGAAKTCDAAFALVQAGVPAPPGAKLQLYGRLSRSESVFFLGRDADKITEADAAKGYFEHDGTETLDTYFPPPEPDGEQLDEPLRASVEGVIAALEALALRCRSQSLSVLVPMGGEMAYRYQEQLSSRLSPRCAASSRDATRPPRIADWRARPFRG